MPDKKDDDIQEQKPKDKKKRKGVRPKLGLDPLDRGDIDALTSQGAVPDSTPEGHTGIDALIRDTDAAPVADEPPAEPQSNENLMVTDMPEDKDMDIENTNEADIPEESELPQEEAGRDEIPESAEIETGQDTGDERPALIDMGEGDEPEVQDSEASEDATPQEPETMQEPETKVELPESSVPTATDSSREAHEEATFDLQTLFSFKLAKECFAIDIDRVKEVLEYSIPTRVPRTPPHMKGVINLRGSVVPVVDLRMLFGMPEGEKTVDSAVIIVEVEIKEEQSKIGVIVDAVREVTELKDSDIEPAPRVGTLINIDFIKGMGKVMDRDGVEFVMILDVDRIFTIEELLGKKA